MTKRISKSILVLFLLFTSVNLTANENIPISEEEKEDTSVHNFPLAEEIVGTNLENQRDKYLKEKNRKLGFTNKGSYLGWGSSSIEADPKAIDFAQKRIMAFEKAFIDAKAEFVRTKKQQVATSLTRKFFNDDNDHEEVELKDGRIAGIAKKLAAVTEAKLDKMLNELGVDPKTIENSDVTKKRSLAEDSLSKEVSTIAVQNVSGIRILATFEDLKGVGVLIVQSPKYAQLAKAMVSKKLVAIPTDESPVDNVANQLESKFVNNNSYLPQYGVRIMNDSVGNRVLVSFGQWSPKVTKSDSKMKINMAVKAAKNIAYDQALSYMTMFMNTTLALENKTKLKDSNEIEQISRTDGSESVDETSNVGALTNQFIKENSRVTIEGVSTVKTWTTNHPETGHLVVGKVLMWSPVTQEYARQKTKVINNVKTSTPKKAVEVKNKIHKSVDFGNEDF